jgi:hypothetical protein
MLPAVVQLPVPGPVPVQAPVQPPVVNVPLVAAVQAPPVAVQQLVGQVQDLVIRHVTIVPDQASTAMEVEDDNKILKRLFLKRFGRALPEEEKEKDDVDLNMDLIDLTEEPDEMEADPSPVLVPLPIIKTEQIEIADSDMAEANPVEQVNPMGYVYERKDMTDAELEAEQRAFDAEFVHIEQGDDIDDEFDAE